MERVYCCKDEDGHWYVIPYELKEEFYSELEKLIEDDYNDYQAVNEFEFKYSQYRTGGDLNLKSLYAEI